MTDDVDFDAELRAEIGFPPAREEFFGFEPLEDDFVDEASGEPQDFPFTHELFISELAEPYLGLANYEKLEEAFANVEGVATLMWQDRDAFFLTLEAGADEAAVEEGLWQAFLQIAKTALAA